MPASHASNPAAPIVDPVDTIVALWRQCRPDLDPSSTEVVGRIERLEYFINRRISDCLAGFGVNIGEFDVLAALRRTEPDYQLCPGALQHRVLITSGALTNRLNRLEQAELIGRLQDPNDRRGVIVKLTPKGMAVIEASIGAVLATERSLLVPLNVAEQQQLAELLKKMLLTQE